MTGLISAAGLRLPGYLLSRDGFQRWNKAGNTILGYTDEEISTMRPIDFFSEADIPRVTEAIGKVLREGNASVEAEFVTKDKRKIPYEIYGSLLKDSSGQCIGICGVGRDITERKQAEKALHESESFIRAVLDNLPVGIAVNSVDPTVKFEYMNNNFPKYYRTTREKLADPDAFWNAVYEDPKFREEIKKRVLDDCASGDPERMYWVDVPISRKGEHTTFISARNIPVPNKKLMISIVWDVTERKKAEEELRRHRDHLEELVRDRTSELENANLELQVLNKEIELRRQEAETSKLQALAASRAKSDFLANMSHELRTPLNSIIGFSEILQDELYGKLNEKQKEYANDIEGSGRHLLNLINDILDLSKVESGKMELELTKFPLTNVLVISLTMLKEKAMKHSIKLSLDIEQDADIEIEADERKLKQIMFNLLSNAVKFTPDGGSVYVTARKLIQEVEKLGNYEVKKSHDAQLLNFLTSQPHDRNFIEISIEDTGIGIKSEDMDKLFKEFSQLESPYTKNHEGTGLGLALTKRLIELHGGKIWVESEFGKGSKFTFVIPMKQSTKN
ncbi:MAG: ATP-binding protein [Nitrospirota bacterium]